MIEQNIIAEIISRIDIVDLIGQHLKVKKSGNNYFANCPFHNEKTPSFSINTQQQFFHCFGCNESGDAISFYMKFHGLDFIDAVSDLANKCGVTIPKESFTNSKFENDQKKEQLKTIIDIMNRISKFYASNLLVFQEAKDYFNKRELLKTTIDTFSLGYAPNNNSLAKLFSDYESNKMLLDCGVVIDGDSRFDRFRSRVIFPIKNSKGNVIAFGGRSLDNKEPKYLNSPETVLFNKSIELYGLYEGQKTIRDKNSVLVVEGYFDVITLHQFGINNTVGTLGTAVSEEHIKKLFRMCDNIYFCFDGDKAGFKAASRALELSISLITDNKSVYFVFLPDGYDPDKFMLEKKLSGFKNFIKYNHLSFSQFLFKQLCHNINLKTNDGKAKLISITAPYLEKTNAFTLKMLLKQNLAQLVGVDLQLLESIINKKTNYKFYNSRIEKMPSIKNISSPQTNEIILIIKNAINNIELINAYCLPEDISKFNDTEKELIKILDFIQNNNLETDLINKLKLLDIHKINLNDLDNHSYIQLSSEAFNKLLNDTFNLNKKKPTKTPKINIPNKK